MIDFGIKFHPTHVDTALIKTLRADAITRFKPLEKTPLIRGQRPDEDSQWLIVDSTYPAAIAERHKLLLEKPDWVMALRPSEHAIAAAHELCARVADYLTTTYPDYFFRKKHMLSSPLTGLSVDLKHSNPLAAMMVMASEDLVLMLGSEKDPQPVVVGGTLAFPNGWSLVSRFKQLRPKPDDAVAMAVWQAAQTHSQRQARMGQSARFIHEGIVEHYDEVFAGRVDAYLRNMNTGHVFDRRNWGPSLHNRLFNHADLPEALVASQYGGAALTADDWKGKWVRVEQETLTRLPQSGAVVFGMKAYMFPIEKMLADKDVRTAMLAAYDHMKANEPLMYQYRAAVLPSYGAYIHQRAKELQAAP